MKVEHQVEVDSTAERLWDILTDVKNWQKSQGTSCVEPPAGPFGEGSRFVASGGGVKWKIAVTEADRPRRIVWVGRRVGLAAIREWKFEQIAGKTRVVSREEMSGWMLPLVYPLVKTQMLRKTKMWLNSLKSRAEGT